MMFRKTSGDPTAETSVSPDSMMMYTVTASSWIGCTESDDVVVVVNELSFANAGADITVCSGADSRLTALDERRLCGILEILYPQ